MNKNIKEKINKKIKLIQQKNNEEEKNILAFLKGTFSEKDFLSSISN